MRENNFSIPNANKASVGITPALYDRRALDCTSTLPLVNSLSNLAYLTTSSARIRDILTIDGGVERLVSILKEGRSTDPMEMWKWNLAFQCIVNIGVRGSEAVRTRVVEADVVPVVATFLDNYMQVIELCQEKELASRHATPSSSTAAQSSRPSARSIRTDQRTSHSQHRTDRTRRQAPPPIEIPQTTTLPDAESLQTRSAAFHHQPPFSSPPDQTTFARQRQHSLNPTQQPFQPQQPRTQFSTPVQAPQAQQVEQIFTSSPFRDNVSGFGIRPVRDVDRLPSSMLSTSNTDLSSQPVSPSTPAPASGSQRNQDEPDRPTRRPSIRHQLSVSGTNWEDEEEQNADSVQPTSDLEERSSEDIVSIQNDVVMQDGADDENMLDGSATPITLSVPTVNVADTDAYMPPHRSVLDDSRTNGTPPQPPQTGFNPVQPLPPVNLVNVSPPIIRQTLDAYCARMPNLAGLFAFLPRDEDVIMALQLLAYVSKYCNLRSYFQETHLVPRLAVGAELQALASESALSSLVFRTQEELDDEWDNEFVWKPNEVPYNISPLIERFTIRTSSSKHVLHPISTQQSETMQYWAGVVMRNLCRKDESRGGIRQCAYWRCGKWEEYLRQFAKCRRCRRTKYCSKECQKGAWGTHRFWCVAAEDGREGESSRHHGHHHHRSHTHQQGTQSRDAATPR